MPNVACTESGGNREMFDVDTAAGIYGYLVKELGPMSSTALGYLSVLFKMAESHEKYTAGSMPMSVKDMERDLEEYTQWKTQYNLENKDQMTLDLDRKES